MAPNPPISIKAEFKKMQEFAQLAAKRFDEPVLNKFSAMVNDTMKAIDASKTPKERANITLDATAKFNEFVKTPEVRSLNPAAWQIILRAHDSFDKINSVIIQPKNINVAPQQTQAAPPKPAPVQDKNVERLKPANYSDNSRLKIEEIKKIAENNPKLANIVNENIGLKVLKDSDLKPIIKGKITKEQKKEQNIASSNRVTALKKLNDAIQISDVSKEVKDYMQSVTKLVETEQKLKFEVKAFNKEQKAFKNIPKNETPDAAAKRTESFEKAAQRYEKNNPPLRSERDAQLKNTNDIAQSGVLTKKEPIKTVAPIQAAAQQANKPQPQRQAQGQPQPQQPIKQQPSRPPSPPVQQPKTPLKQPVQQVKQPAQQPKTPLKQSAQPQPNRPQAPASKQASSTVSNQNKKVKFSKLLIDEAKTIGKGAKEAQKLVGKIASAAIKKAGKITGFIR